MSGLAGWWIVPVGVGSSQLLWGAGLLLIGGVVLVMFLLVSWGRYGSASIPARRTDEAGEATAKTPPPPARVLVVEADDGLRAEIVSWLEDEGLQPLACQGPLAPDYQCAGQQEGGCPLLNSADLVVLDLRLAGDVFETGTTGEDVAEYYVGSGRRVVGMKRTDDPEPLWAGDRLSVCAWPPGRTELVGAVRATLAAPVPRGAELTGAGTAA